LKNRPSKKPALADGKHIHSGFFLGLFFELEHGGEIFF
jgi:hypothetical protein